jgi:phage head maturation protease
MHAGALALSIGFQTVAADYSTDGARLLKAVKLFEVSIVAMPANPSARITQVKATNIREFETKLRDIGFSVREARKLATGGWSALTRIDDSQELTQAAHEISSMAKLFGG